MKFADIQEEIANMLDVPDTELSEEQIEIMNSYLDELADQEESKVDSFGQFLRIESARAEALRAESQRLAARARTAENRINFLKMKYMQIMDQHGLKKVNGQVYSISVRATDIVQITDEAVLPQEYVTQKVTTAPDKTALRDALKQGQTIPGAQLAKSYSLRVA
jgi:hypothetical protein